MIFSNYNGTVPGSGRRLFWVYYDCCLSAPRIGRFAHLQWLTDRLHQLPPDSLFII